jgi:hypothetical protein
VGAGGGTDAGSTCGLPERSCPAPDEAESFAESVASGRFVYVAVHGVNGPLMYRGGEFTPGDVARTMAIGKNLEYVYLSACHSGDLAADWQSVLAPAKVVTFPRVSLYLEHAVFLWYTAPRLIAGNNFSFAGLRLDALRCLF